MAEIAAGAVAAEEIVSTTIQGGVAAYAVAKPTQPLKATYNQVATARDDETRRSLVRSDHSATVVGNKVYIFGGLTTGGKLASNDVHSVTLAHTEKKPDPDYSLLPAIPSTEGGRTPPARSHHGACKLNVCVAIFGGRDESGKVIDEDSLIWLYNTSKQSWETTKAEEAEISPVARANARLFEWDNNLILYGGEDINGHPLKDVWHFDYASRVWKPFESAPVSTANAALSDGRLYLISAPEAMSGELHSLDIGTSSASWSTNAFATNPFNPGPRPRTGGGLVPIHTGYGRRYLLYFLGARQNPATSATASPTETLEPTQWSDIWTIQLPSSEAELKATTSLSEMIKPAAIKDAIRTKLGYDSGEHSWAEVEVVPPGDTAAAGPGIMDVAAGEGKVHPGPRAFFGCDVMADGVTVVMWGGLNAKGEREADGWVVRVA